MSEEEKQHKKNQSVMVYILILFFVAFLLMALSLLMNQRNNEAIGEIKQSVSDMNGIQIAQDRIIALQDSLAEKERSLEDAEDREVELQSELKEQKAQVASPEGNQNALLLLSALHQKYLLGNYQECQNLIDQNKAVFESLPRSNPYETISPYESYLAIRNSLAQSSEQANS